MLRWWLQCLLEAVLHHLEGPFGHLYAYPLSAKFLGSYAGGGTTAKGVQDYITFMTTGEDDALQERAGLLGGVTCSCLAPCAQRIDIFPYVAC